MTVKLTDSTICDDEGCCTTQGLLLGAAGNDRGAALSKVGAKLTKLGLAREIESKSGSADLATR